MNKSIGIYTFNKVVCFDYPKNNSGLSNQLVKSTVLVLLIVIFADL